MHFRQQFLFAPEQPLVKRLGQEFFRSIPSVAGVYKMHNANGRIIYVGKAKDLRQRLRSYRTANPEQMSRRHLRLVNEVTRIEFDVCCGESEALKHEAKLIRQLRPKFNRAGVWQGKPQFLTWRFLDDTVEFALQETPEAGWERFGSLGAYAARLRSILVRLIWCVLNTDQIFYQMPHGWMRGIMPEQVKLQCGKHSAELKELLFHAFWGDLEVFINGLRPMLDSRQSAFERTALANDVDEFKDFLDQLSRRGRRDRQMELL